MINPCLTFCPKNSEMEDDEYEEFRLISTGKGPAIMPHHIMKIQSGKFDIDTLPKPIKMSRKQDAYEKEPEESNTYFKKKSKAFFLPRDHQDVVLGGTEIRAGSLIAPIGSRFADPDKFPWILSDAENQQYTGNLEGSQSANHVLFLSVADGFRVIPVSKWYKFLAKSNHRTLTLEEAEEKMKDATKASSLHVSDRWLMKESSERGESTSKSSVKSKTMKSWKQKLMATDEPVTNTKSRKKDMDKMEIGMDYDEEFADDEEVDFGIEDRDEAKEAQRRLHQKDNSGEVDPEDVWQNAAATV